MDNWQVQWFPCGCGNQRNGSRENACVQASPWFSFIRCLLTIRKCIVSLVNLRLLYDALFCSTFMAILALDHNLTLNCFIDTCLLVLYCRDCCFCCNVEFMRI
ncbi:hypothetical protein AAZX31_04G143200 [Glycine max]